MLLKLRYVEPVSNVASNFNLRRYTLMRWARVSGDTRMATLALPWAFLVDRWFGAPLHALPPPPRTRARTPPPPLYPPPLLSMTPASPSPSESASPSDAVDFRSNVTRLVFLLAGHDVFSDRGNKVSAATAWTMQSAPAIIERWQAVGPGGSVTATATWRQLWAFKELITVTLWVRPAQPVSLFVRSVPVCPLPGTHHDF
jgi:hypothetical protein